MEIVKITKLVLDEKGNPMFDDIYNDIGDEVIRQDPIVEDIICTVLKWSRLANEGEKGIFYEDVVWLRRNDDGTVELCKPDEMVYLDVIQTVKNGKVEETKEN